MDAPTEQRLRARYPARAVRHWSRAQGWPTPTRGVLHVGAYEMYHAQQRAEARAWQSRVAAQQEAVVGQIQRAHR